MYAGACCNPLEGCLYVCFSIPLYYWLVMIYAKYEEKKKIPCKENAFFVRVWVSRGRGCGVGRMGGWAECAVADLWRAEALTFLKKTRTTLLVRDRADAVGFKGFESVSIGLDRQGAGLGQME